MKIDIYIIIIIVIIQYTVLGFLGKVKVKHRHSRQHCSFLCKCVFETLDNLTGTIRKTKQNNKD